MPPITDQRVPTLRGDGLSLRALTRSDAGAFLELFGDPEVVRWTTLQRLVDEEAAQALIAEVGREVERGTRYQWALEEDDEVVGTAILAHVDTRHRHAEVGFAVVRRRWGRRIVSRALPPLLRFAFETLGLHRLEAHVEPGNTASLRVLERQGFEREGRLRERTLQGDAWQDSIVLGLLRRDRRGG